MDIILNIKLKKYNNEMYYILDYVSLFTIIFLLHATNIIDIFFILTLHTLSNKAILIFYTYNDKIHLNFTK